MTKAGRRLLTSARPALAYAEGRAEPGAYIVHVPEALKAIRRKSGHPREEFARHFPRQFNHVQAKPHAKSHRRGQGAVPWSLTVNPRPCDALYQLERYKFFSGGKKWKPCGRRGTPTASHRAVRPRHSARYSSTPELSVI